jgi:hypothetical protein
VVRALLEAGADVGRFDVRGRTARDHARDNWAASAPEILRLLEAAVPR